jgi:hypothetical protein
VFRAAGKYGFSQTTPEMIKRELYLNKIRPFIKAELRERGVKRWWLPTSFWSGSSAKFNGGNSDIRF